MVLIETMSGISLWCDLSWFCKNYICIDEGKNGMRIISYLQVSHLSCRRASLRAQSGFTVFMNDKSRTMCSVLKNVGFFSVSALLPDLLQAFLSTGYCYMF